MIEAKNDGLHRVRFFAGRNRVDRKRVGVRATSFQSTDVKLILLKSIRQQHELIVVDV